MFYIIAHLQRPIHFIFFPRRKPNSPIIALIAEIHPGDTKEKIAQIKQIQTRTLANLTAKKTKSILAMLIIIGVKLIRDIKYQKEQRQFRSYKGQALSHSITK